MLFSNENQYTFGANSDAIKTGVVSVQFVNPETNEVYNVNNTNKPMLLEIPGRYGLGKETPSSHHYFLCCEMLSYNTNK